MLKNSYFKSIINRLIVCSLTDNLMEFIHVIKDSAIGWFVKVSVNFRLRDSNLGLSDVESDFLSFHHCRYSFAFILMRYDFCVCGIEVSKAKMEFI